MLFATDRIPEAPDVDAFCEELDRGGFGPTLVLCDSNASPDRYFALSNALRSRGRRHLIVGTSYRQEQRDRQIAIDLVEAPEGTSPAERADLATLLERFAHSEFRQNTSLDGEHVLALLYRSISASRPRLASGLSGEAYVAENALRTRTQRAKVGRPRTEMGQKLIDAGISAGEQALFETLEDAVEDQEAPGRLIDYVMVAGRIDVAIPLNLLLRALRARITSLDYHIISELFGGLDLFRWRYGDEEKTELLVGARLRLEAELICRRRLADSDRELECLVDLIEAVRPRGVDHDSELRFLLDLLQRLDREGPRSRAYAGDYLRIGEALTNLRTQHGVDDASLMLQESNFRRQWLSSNRSEGTIPSSVRDRVLDEAREAVEEALAKIEGQQLRAGRRTRENLYVERASIYGFLAVGHAKNRAKPEIVWADYLAARVATRRAMGVAPSYFPFDVGLWTPSDVLTEAGEGLSDAQRAELVADIYSTLDRVDPQDLSPDQRERFNVRRTKVAGTLKDSALEEAASRDLEAESPAVAVFLNARSIAPEVLANF